MTLNFGHALLLHTKVLGLLFSRHCRKLSDVTGFSNVALTFSERSNFLQYVTVTFHL